MDIRLAKESDIAKITEFIKLNWRKDHIFVTNKSFFHYEMCPRGVPNFILALDSEKVIGILGFVCNRCQVEESDLFLVMFRVLKSRDSVSTGIKLVQFAQGLTKFGLHTVGANKRVLPYYMFVGFRTGYLDHYYWLNEKPALRKFFLANASKNTIPKSSFIMSDSVSQLIKMSASEVKGLKLENEIDTGHRLLKSKSFFLRRYINHPVYKYLFFKDPRCKGLLVIREVTVNKYPAWRIVDWYGDVENFTKVLGSLINSARIENIAFLDLYVAGIPKEEALKVGLHEISDEVVIPNLLEPLVMSNVSISYVTSNDATPFMVRGDGDQDRPS